MSLAFLAKKSWHTTNLDNVERVWIAEQKQEQERKKVAELQKQLAEERQILELRQLQAASGQTVKNVDTTLDWMYEGPAGQSVQKQSTEDYLLGKVYQAKDEIVSDLHELAMKKAEGAAGALWLNKVNSKNDTFTRLHEDPLLSIRQREQRSREQIVNNPVKMARIRHEIANQLAEEESKRKEKKAAKKAAKKAQKSKDRSRSRSRDRSSSHRNIGENSGLSRRDTGGMSYDSNREERGHRDYANDRRYNDKKSGRDYDDSNYGTDADRHSVNDGDRNCDQPNDRKRARNDSTLYDRKHYGLLKSSLGSASSSDVRAKNFSGPSPELLAKKAEKDRLEREAKLKPRESAKQLSEEEKRRRIEAMEADAKRLDKLRVEKHTRRDAFSSSQKDNAIFGGQNFLKSMRTEVYTNSNSSSIEDRMKQNKYYYQRGDDMDSSGFMKR